MTLSEPAERGAPPRRRRREVQEQRQQFVRPTPIRSPAQLVVHEPAEDVGLAEARGATLLRTLRDVPGEGRVERVGKLLPRRLPVQVVLRPRERHAEVEVRRNRQHRSSVGDRLVRPRAERIEAPARKPLRHRGAPAIDAAVFAPAGLRIGDALGALNLVLVEAYGVDALRQEAPAVGIDQPECAVVAVDAESPARPRPAVGHAAPSRPFNGTVHGHERARRGRPDP